MDSRPQPSPIGASLPIKPFEVSRWCLRRTRQQPLCVFNRALVLRRGVAGDLKVDRKMGSLACHGLILASERMGPTIFPVPAFAQTHIKHPGTPARVVRQEKELTKSYPVHVAGCSATEQLAGHNDLHYFDSATADGTAPPTWTACRGK